VSQHKQDELEFTIAGNAHVLFTTRAQENLSLATGKGHEHGVRARDALCDALGLDWLCASPQVHGTTVTRVTERCGERGAPLKAAADGHVTSVSSLGMMVLSADCLPVALSAEGVVGMVHAGWRGLAAGVLEEGVSAVRELGGMGEMSAVVGPCAGSCCYEVGEEVHDAFAGRHRDGRHIDLGAIARDRLLAAGVLSVQRVTACTICDERFFSHRREGDRAGRQAGIAWLS
jgi:hypothetical protein